MSNSQKTPFSVSINSVIAQRISDALQGLGNVLPCHVVAVDGAIVTVNFDVQVNNNFTLPPVTCSTIGSRYIRIPLQIGDKGICISADVKLGGITGLGKGAAPITSASNLGALIFIPVGNVDWDDISSTASFMRDANNSVSVTLDAGSANVDGNMSVSGNLSAGNGITCMFTTLTGQTVTVQNGIVTNLI